MRARNHELGGICAGGLLAAAGAAFGQVAFTGLGPAPGGLGTFGNAVTPGGSIAAGSTTGFRAFAWTSGTGSLLLPLLPSGVQSFANGISGDGAVIVGSCSDGSTVFPVRWVAGSIESLGVLGGVPGGSCNAANHDGSVVVGTSSFNTVARGWKWTAATGLQQLESLSNGYNTAASGITADSSVIVGYAESAAGRYAVRWTQSGIENLGRLAGAIQSVARGVSDDGHVVVGTSGPSFSVTYAFRWTLGSGIQPLPLPAGATSSSAVAANHDGSIIVGSSTISTSGRAVVWRSGAAPVILLDYLASLGLNMTGWELTGVSDVSPDGRVFVGSGRFNGAQRAWIVSGLNLNVCDSVDFNNDGSLFDPTDVDAFLSIFSEGPCIPALATCNDVDFNNDGSLFDPTDIDAFLSVFSEGPCL